jgi:hypothetical protein
MTYLYKIPHSTYRFTILAVSFIFIVIPLSLTYPFLWLFDSSFILKTTCVFIFSLCLLVGLAGLIQTFFIHFKRLTVSLEVNDKFLELQTPYFAKIRTKRIMVDEISAYINLQNRDGESKENKFIFCFKKWQKNSFPNLLFNAI